MPYVPTYDHSLSTVLTSGYAILLLALMIRFALTNPRRPVQPKLGELLDKLELVRTDGVFASDHLKRSGGKLDLVIPHRGPTVAECREALRRMSGNVQVLAALIELDYSNARPENQKLIRNMLRKCNRLKLCIRLLRIASPRIWHMPSIRILQGHVQKDYWCLVRDLHARYCLTDARRSGALATACNLVIAL